MHSVLLFKHVLKIVEFFHYRNTQIYHHMTQHWQLQSAQRGTVVERNFPPGQISTDSVNWRCLWGVRQVCSSTGAGSSEVMFVSVSLRVFKINLSLENWQTCHIIVVFSFLYFLREIGPILTRRREGWSRVDLWLWRPVGRDCCFGASLIKHIYYNQQNVKHISHK